MLLPPFLRVALPSSPFRGREPDLAPGLALGPLVGDDVAQREEAIKATHRAFGALNAKGISYKSSFEEICSLSLMNKTFWFDTNRFDLNKLRTLHVPIWKLDEQDPDISYLNVGKNEYFLLAVVRLMDDKHPGEYVLTYGIHGSNIVGERQPPSIVNHDCQPSQDDVDKAMPEPPSQQEPADVQTATGSPRKRAAQTSEGEVSKRRSRGKRRGKGQGDTGLGSGEPPGSPKTAPQRKGKPDRFGAPRDARRDAA
ncbi:hypothetical protein FMEXI_11820 [Fusarium mexicanum]|uniref:Uncharacterized protein n=1 Tax=Fusarium mexicanum TaxID=751941 RepID=A0A8H5MLV9_9HYPO|nr:hypothetical protein FMEXI_11820 [Fusarium mexicanum]